MTRQILIIDDNEAFCETTADILRDEGYAVAYALSGEQGTARVASHRPHLLLLDWKMTGMSGLDTLRQIRAQGGQDIAVVLMTAYSSEEVQQDARGLDVAACLMKGTAMGVVLGTLERIFGGRGEHTR